VVSEAGVNAAPQTNVKNTSKVYQRPVNAAPATRTSGVAPVVVPSQTPGEGRPRRVAPQEQR
jgi:hypothetical protein